MTPERRPEVERVCDAALIALGMAAAMSGLAATGRLAGLEARARVGREAARRTQCENQLRQNSKAETARALREHFILERIAEDEKIEVSPDSSIFSSKSSLFQRSSVRMPMRTCGACRRNHELYRTAPR